MDENLIGKEIGGCKILSLLGRGGMGSVYKAHHLNLDIPVAIKILDRHLSHSKDLVERFITEARAAAKLDSPHIVRVMQVAEENGIYFIQMEFVPGYSLAEIIKLNAPLNFKIALQYLYQITLGLCVAHQEGIIHRDIKPDNILVSSKGILKIADFGLAKLLQSGSGLTQSGQILGTPYYLSPEQCEGKSIDERGDIYALGISFYFMLTGKLPFFGDSPLAIAVSRLHVTPTSPKSIVKTIPDDIEHIVNKMMERLPQNRYTVNKLLEVIVELLGKYDIPLHLTNISLSSLHLPHEKKVETAILNQRPLNEAYSDVATLVDIDEESRLNTVVINGKCLDESSVATVVLNKARSEDAVLNDIANEKTYPSVKQLEESLHNDLPKDPIKESKPNLQLQKKRRRFRKRYIVEMMLVIFLSLSMVADIEQKLSPFEDKKGDDDVIAIMQNLKDPKVLNSIDVFRKKYPDSKYNKVLVDIYKKIKHGHCMQKKIDEIKAKVVQFIKKGHIINAVMYLFSHPHHKLDKKLKLLFQDEKFKLQFEAALHHEIVTNVRNPRKIDFLRKKLKKLKRYGIKGTILKKENNSFSFFNEKSHTGHAKGTWRIEYQKLVARALRSQYKYSILWKIPRKHFSFNIKCYIFRPPLLIRFPKKASVMIVAQKKLYTIELPLKVGNNAFELNVHISETKKFILNGSQIFPPRRKFRSNATEIAIVIQGVRIEIHSMNLK